MDELARARVAVAPAPMAAREGEKGAAHSFAELVLTGGLSAATVTAVATVIVGFVQRGAARKLVLRDGDRELEVTGVSARDARTAVEAFLGHIGDPAAGREAAPAGPGDGVGRSGEPAGPA
ncbi:hypothetical protein [Micromonospora ureilytica]|nr:hypothetical protein [Micromonospora ureilytica]